MDGLMMKEIVAQESGADNRQGRVPVRFWKPVPERPDEFDCAYLDGGIASPHVHEEWQFAVAAVPYAISIGAFRRYIGGPDHVTVIQPYDVHTEHGMLGGPREWWVLHVAPSVIDHVYENPTGNAPRFGAPLVKDRQSARRLAELLRANLEGRLEGQGFANQALDWLRRLLQGQDIRPTTAAVTRGPGASIERARAYLQAHATEPLLLSELVGVAGVTTSHLVRSFSRLVGLPPKSYQTQIRLARARRLLAQGRAATWVAYECGFADQSHLSRRFKEFYGVTPGAFQAHYQAQPVTTPVGAHAA